LKKVLSSRLPEAVIRGDHHVELVHVVFGDSEPDVSPLLLAAVVQDHLEIGAPEL
jgi:hypothetical protein